MIRLVSRRSTACIRCSTPPRAPRAHATDLCWAFALLLVCRCHWNHSFISVLLLLLSFLMEEAKSNRNLSCKLENITSPGKTCYSDNGQYRWWVLLNDQTMEAIKRRVFPGEERGQADKQRGQVFQKHTVIGTKGFMQMLCWIPTSCDLSMSWLPEKSCRNTTDIAVILDG